jgi:NADH-quinone oxidoreductase subunit G
VSEAPKPIVVDQPVTITVNGAAIQAQKGDLLIDACERAGTYIPRFCYHPRMNPVGMCRMCLVDVDTGRGAALQPSCMLECSEGMTVDTENEKVKKAQDGVLEFLLINHPLDCPVCDKGGECPLQDTTVGYGPGESRWVEEKRHYEKPIAISETVQLDRERCILCDRCTRFADEVAGDPLIHFMGRGANTEVNTFPDEPFASYFSGNTVQICPVGALTAKPYRFKARPWDLEEVASTCTDCAVGCSVTIQSSRDEVLRINGVDNDAVNWGWLCDKGRFGFEAIGSPDRLQGPLELQGDELVSIHWSDAVAKAAALISEGLRSGGPQGLAVIGGARLTNEAAYAWTKLIKGALGSDNVDAQLGDGLPAELVLGLPGATINEACTPGGTIIYLGPDPKEALPTLFLRLRHAIVEDGARLIELTSTESSLMNLAAASLLVRPGETASAVRAIRGGGGDAGGADVEQVRRAIDVLSGGGPVTVLIGRTSAAESPQTVVAAAEELMTLDGVRFLPLLPRSNVRGALEAGMSPGLLPGRVRRSEAAAWFGQAWPTIPQADGLDTAGILAAAAAGKIDTLILLGADPLADFVDRELAERALTGARSVIVVDPFLNESARRANVVLASSAFGEVSGTVTNIEGRVQRVTQKVTPPGTARADWELACDLGEALGNDLNFDGVEAIWAEFQDLSPVHAELSLEAIEDPANIDGLLAVAPTEVQSEEPLDSATDSADDSDGASAEDPSDAVADPAESEVGDAAQVAEPEETDGLELVSSPDVLRYFAANDQLVIPYDGGTLLSHSPSSASLVKEAVLTLNPLDFEKLGVTTGAAVRVSNGARSILIPVEPSASVPRGVAACGVNLSGVAVSRLIDSSSLVTDVRIEVQA